MILHSRTRHRPPSTVHRPLSSVLCPLQTDAGKKKRLSRQIVSKVETKNPYAKEIELVCCCLLFASILSSSFLIQIYSNSKRL